MPDIIRLLPEAVANQIAAGEVIQRPASVVKELLENSIDSGASLIKLLVKDAGKSMIQVIDNGCGMSETDARLCFERHATSKIRTIDDLFSIRTMGFRGEALASIASISQVEIKTKKHEDELGTEIQIEGGHFKSQQACTLNRGTSIAVKNLFYNVPARRKFLKSEQIEIRHILDEFHRIALVNPEVEMSMYHNNKQVFLLKTCTLQQRIIQVFGTHYRQRLVPVDQKTDYLNIMGFIGKPEYAKKTRGDQFIFANNRFIRHPYLNHAIENAYQELIPERAFPTYFLYIESDPKHIDINIHPTKTEIKFEDEKMVYAVIRSAVKLALGKFSLTPTIDFDVEQSFNEVVRTPDHPVRPPEIKINPDYNPFEKKGINQGQFSKKANRGSNLPGWEKLYEVTKEFSQKPQNEHYNNETPLIDTREQDTINTIYFQLHNKYIITKIKSGLLVIDQQKAHERILFEYYSEVMDKKHQNTQQLLYPQTITCTHHDASLMKELLEEIRILGFDINELGNNSFIINGIPSEIPESNAKDYLEGILEYYKTYPVGSTMKKPLKVALSLAKKMAVRHGKSMKNEEMQMLVDKLFTCKTPYIAPDGKPTLITLSSEEIENKFNKKT